MTGETLVRLVLGTVCYGFAGFTLGLFVKTVWRLLK